MSKRTIFFRSSLFSTIVLICANLVSPAQAQGDFSGGYAGAEVGYLGIDTNGILTNDPNGVYYGGFLGYRGQNSSGLVYGIEGYFGDSSANASEMIGPITVNVDMGRIFGFDGILGYAASNKVLIFAHAGYINAKITLSTPSLPISVSDSEGGWRAGGGVEVILKNNVNIRVKISYGEIEDIDFFSALAGILVTF